MPAPNLRYIRTLPAQWRLSTRQESFENVLSLFRRRIILKSMYKFYDPKIVEEVKAQRRSIVSDSALIADFEKTEQPPVNLKRDYHYRRALKVMRKHFAPKELYKPVAFPDLRYYNWRLNVSAEAPYKGSPKWAAYLAKKFKDGQVPNANMTFRNMFDELFWVNRHLVHKIKDGDPAFFEADGTPRPYYWVNLHARAHVVGPDDDDKIRAVFGVPKLLLFVENMFIWPMQADLLNRDPYDSPLLWGNEIMRGGWKRLRHNLNRKTRGQFSTILSADWSQFDRRALFSIIDDVHEIWYSFYDMSGAYQPTNFYPNASTNPERIDNLWRWFTHNVKYYPILLPDGRLMQWSRNGVASGYQETQLMDSWINGIMLLTVLSEIGVNIEADTFFFRLQGDDSLIAFSEPFFQIYGKRRLLSLISEAAERRFNAVLSVDKSDVHNELNGVYVLGYYNNYGCAWRTDVDLLSHLLFPERVQTIPATAGTAIGIAMAAQGCSRRVYDVCLDVFKFITQELGEQPRIDASMTRKLYYLVGMTEEESELLATMPFPSFQKTYYQNFVLDTRSESERQRTWPTDPMYTGGFHFL